MKKLKWGILGPGIIANEFVEDFRWVKSAECTAVASRSLARAEHFALSHGIDRAYGSYAELYNDPNIDAIYIATPHSFHQEQAAHALKAGKHVLCEKPICTNQIELQALLKIASQTEKYLIEGMWTYFLPAIVQAKKWIDQGRIGKILHLKSEFGYQVPFDAESRMYNAHLAGGVLLDMGIYNIAMAHYFLGANFQDLSVSYDKEITGVDNDVVTHYRVEEAQAHLHASFKCKLQNFTMITGDRGMITIPRFWQARECHIYEGDELLESFNDHRLGHGFEYEIEEVSKEILEGKLKPSVLPHETSLAFQRKMDLIRSKTVKG